MSSDAEKAVSAGSMTAEKFWDSGYSRWIRIKGRGGGATSDAAPQVDQMLVGTFPKRNLSVGPCASDRRPVGPYLIWSRISV